MTGLAIEGQTVAPPVDGVRIGRARWDFEGVAIRGGVITDFSIGVSLRGTGARAVRLHLNANRIGIDDAPFSGGGFGTNVARRNAAGPPECNPTGLCA